MFKVLIFTSLLVVLASCKPDHLVAPVVAPAVVTAQSSQYFVRNHNGLFGPIIAEAAPLLEPAAPIVEPAAPIFAAEPVIQANHLVAQPILRRAPLVAEQLVRAAPLLAEAKPVLRTAPYVAEAPLVVESKPVLGTSRYVAEAPLVVDSKPVLRTAPFIAEAPLVEAQPAPFVAEAPLVAQHLGAIFRSAPLVAETPLAKPVFRTSNIVAEQALLAERLVQAQLPSAPYVAEQPAKAEPAPKTDRLVQAGQNFKSAAYRAEPASKLMGKAEAPLAAERAPKMYQTSQPRPSNKKVNTEPLVETLGQQAAKPAGDNFERLQKAPAEDAVVDAPFLTSSLYTQYYPGYSYYI